MKDYLIIWCLGRLLKSLLKMMGYSLQYLIGDGYRSIWVTGWTALLLLLLRLRLLLLLLLPRLILYLTLLLDLILLLHLQISQFGDGKLPQTRSELLLIFNFLHFVLPLLPPWIRTRWAWAGMLLLLIPFKESEIVLEDGLVSDREP